MIGSKTLEEWADEMGMSVTDCEQLIKSSPFLEELAEKMGMSLTNCKQLIAMRKIPIPFTSDEMIEESKKFPPAQQPPYHARDTVDPDIWFRLYLTKRLRLGYEFYNNPARTIGFLGFDCDNVAVYAYSLV